MRIYDIALQVGLVILAIGVIHRVDAWLLRYVGKGDRSVSVGRRAFTALKGLAVGIFSLRIFAVLRALVVDVLFQARILRDARDPLAWPMHLLVFFGFMLLLIFHALGNTFATLIYPHYAPTLNPFMFLRDLFGLIMLVGLVLAVIRRVVWKERVRTATQDVLALVLVGVIGLSGVLLHGMKIASYDEFTRMVSDYGSDLSVQEIQALRAFWVEYYGTVAPTPASAPEPEVLTLGAGVHISSCAGCHSPAPSAFISYPVAKLIEPVATSLDEAGLVTALWYVHVLSCCLGLVFIAFGKMFHIIGTPVSIFVAEVAGQQQEPAVVANRQVIELDGCSHGGACHDNCLVRRRRLERLADAPAYGPMAAYLGQKSARDLGSRDVSG